VRACVRACVRAYMRTHVRVCARMKLYAAANVFVPPAAAAIADADACARSDRRDG